MSNKHKVSALRERVAVLTGAVRESDLHVIHIACTGDPEEACYVLPSKRGHYKYFRGQQWDEIRAIMRANGYMEDGERQWKRVLSAAEMAVRDKDAPPVYEEPLAEIAPVEPVEALPVRGPLEAPPRQEPEHTEKVYFASGGDEKPHRPPTRDEFMQWVQKEEERCDRIDDA